MQPDRSSSRQMSHQHQAVLRARGDWKTRQPVPPGPQDAVGHSPRHCRGPLLDWVFFCGATPMTSISSSKNIQNHSLV